MMKDAKSIASRSARTPSDSMSGGLSVGNGTAYDNWTVLETSSREGTASVDLPDEESQKVARREDKFIGRVRVLVAFALVAAVTSVAIVAFLLVTKQEQDEFENAFNGHASEVAAIVGQNIEKLFQALDSASVMISSEVSAQNETWPFVTVDHWSLKSDRLFKLGDIGQSMLALAPIVQQGMVNNWTGYVEQQAPSWYQSSINHKDPNRTLEDLIVHTLPYVHTYTVNSSVATPVEREGPLVPIWQSYPLKMGEMSHSIEDLPTNYDILEGLDGDTHLIDAVNATLRPAISLSSIVVNETTQERIARSAIVQPIFEEVDTQQGNAKLVAVLWWQIDWSVVFSNLLDRGVTGIVVVLRSSCQTRSSHEHTSEVTYRINGPRAIFLANNDAHRSEFDEMEMSQVLADLSSDQASLPSQLCVPKVTLHLYPTTDFKNKFVTQEALYYTAVVVLIFCFTSIVFLVYDFLVRQRQLIVMDRIMRQDKIVSDVFPSAIRDRLYNQNIDDAQDSNQDNLLDPLDFGTSNMIGSAPLADLFPNTTVIFADIVGFTAWSSQREPSQVFVLLETIYNAFDKIAYRQSVFKVETVGDCYVAVAGLPEPNEEHAEAACRFARLCLKKMKEITLKLEVSLGPDTADLAMRIGLHSGQVTAGVLRGERSRFQLFGDTMNTAARMEHTGERNRIQLTEATANLLKDAGLERWILPRSTTIFVKGKGNMQTYWMKTVRGAIDRKKSKPRHRASSLDETALTADTSEETSDTPSGGDDRSVSLEVSDDDGEDDLEYDNDVVEEMTKIDRLVEWNVENLSTLLQQIIAARGGVVQSIDGLRRAEAKVGENGTVLEEFIPIIHLKRFEADELRNRMRPTEIDIGEAARTQLRSLLSNIASLYQNNPFHNYEHASHVTASVQKLLSRIVKVGDGSNIDSYNRETNLVDLAGHSYGITTDPLTQFAVVFSAIIHDADHPGVPNSQLVEENTRCAQVYKNKSVAEQNSVDLAWEIFMRNEYKDLRACIYQTEEELRRFRQLVVNTVMATDIVDKELQALRKKRWETAFSGTSLREPEGVSVDRKATIVIEHLIQASDVSHTMQHWHIYKSWNEKFFMECYGAYRAGRANTDPSINWYRGEIGFFDFYVIPLAKKLDDCGVFGVSSDEYLNYAKTNREEWAREGESIVLDFLAKFEERMANEKEN